MTSAAVQQFLEQGQRSGLLCGAAAQEVVAHLTADPAITVDELASGLMEKKILTRYQADELMAGAVTNSWTRSAKGAWGSFIKLAIPSWIASLL